MLLPANTYLYRYCVGDELPKEWSRNVKNPQYAIEGRERKNLIGAYFFYEDEDTAKNVARCALRDYGSQHHIDYCTLTSCHTIEDVNLLDLSGDLKPYPFLETLHSESINVLTDEFLNYFKGQLPFSSYRENFNKLICQKEPFSQSNPNWQNNCTIYEPLLMFFTHRGNMHILGQLVTDFNNGCVFKRLLQERGYEGYIFNEEKDCSTVCLFDSDKLSSPSHQIMNIELDNLR